MIDDRDLPRGGGVNRIRGVTGNDREVRGGEVDRRPRVPGCLTRDQVAVTGLGLGYLLGRQLVSLVIVGVLIGDYPFHPPALRGGVVLMSHVDGQGLVGRRHVAGWQVTSYPVVVRDRQVKLSGLTHGPGNGLGFDHGLMSIVINPANGGRDRWHWIGKGDRQVRVRISDGHGRSGVGVGGMIVMVQHRGSNRVPMSGRPWALLNDLVGDQVSCNTAAEGGTLGLNYLGLVSEWVLVLDNPVGLGRFGAGLQAVGDAQADGLIRLGRQPVVGWLVRGQIVVSRGEVRQQEVLIGNPGQSLGLDNFPMIGIVDQLNFNRLRLGVVDDRDRQRTGRRGGRLGGHGCR